MASNNSFVFLLTAVFLVAHVKCMALNETTAVGNMTEEIIDTEAEEVVPANSTSAERNGTQPKLGASTMVGGHLQEPDSNEDGGIDNDCTTNDQCKLEHSFCIEKRCQCKTPEYTISQSFDKCLKVADSLGDPCTETRQCTMGIHDRGHTMCIQEKCQCLVGLHLTDGVCKEGPVLGVPCDQDNQCVVANSKCLQNVCACPAGYEPNPNNDQCTPHAKNINDSCTEDTQCQDLGEAHCKDNVCICKPLLIIVQGKCTLRKALGDSCNTADECASPDPTDQRDCVDGTCVCATGMQQHKDYCASGAIKLAVGAAILVVLTHLLV